MTKTNNHPTFQASRIARNGKPAIQFIVKFSTLVPELHDAIVAAGYECMDSIANARVFVATTQEEIATARPAILMDYFAKHPEYVLR